MPREEAFRELEALYADLGRELDARNPKCELSGRCCRFRDFGHQLWTTDLELDYLASKSGPPSREADGACPYLEGGRCGVREHRMLGCRVYFCDPGFKDEMGPLYERYHRRVKEIHVRHGIPYAYGELLGKLRERK
jgi:Fe-S-cluster containining protein